jgi:hypothetical protein
VIGKKDKIVAIVLMIVLGTCMHFVMGALPPGGISAFLGNFFPVSETSWEHMKMMWYPFLAVGIIFRLKTGNRGYFASFVVCAVMAMLMNLGAFSIYESFSGKTILILDITIYVSCMLIGALLACELSQKKWAQKLLPLWVALAVIITFGIIWLTYYTGKGYVFLDNEGLTNIDIL